MSIAASSQKFEDKWRSGGMVERMWGRRAGVVGHRARGVVFGPIGIFLAEAAIDYNPKDAVGLDGALQKLAEANYGPYLLGVTAAGLVGYGLYCLVDAAIATSPWLTRPCRHAARRAAPGRNRMLMIEGVTRIDRRVARTSPRAGIRR